VISLRRDPEEHDEPRYENWENTDSARETRSPQTASKSLSSSEGSCRGGVGDGGGERWAGSSVNSGSKKLVSVSEDRCALKGGSTLMGGGTAS